MWLIVGGFGGLMLVMMGVLGLVLWRSERGAMPPAMVEVVNKADPPPEEIPRKYRSAQPGRLEPDENYRRMLKSTVYVVARSPAPALAVQPPPNPPKMPEPKLTQVPIGKTPQKGPDLAKEIGKSVWIGTEDLTGFGKLRFDFCTPTEVVIHDAKDASDGQVGRRPARRPSVSGSPRPSTSARSGDTIIGTAKSRQGGVTWKFAVIARPASPPCRCRDS